MKVLFVSFITVAFANSIERKLFVLSPHSIHFLMPHLIDRLETSNASVEILARGLTIHSLKFKGVDLLVGPEDPLHHQTERGFINCTVGRYANRLFVE